jgi:6-phosphogluconate dehydrogenase
MAPKSLGTGASGGKMTTSSGVAIVAGASWEAWSVIDIRPEQKTRKE